MKTAIINLRVEPSIKKQAEQILHPLGLTTTDAITIFLHKVVMEEGLPFQVRIPNKKTQKAIKDALAGKDSKRYKSLEELKHEFD